MKTETLEFDSAASFFAALYSAFQAAKSIPGDHKEDILSALSRLSVFFRTLSEQTTGTEESLMSEFGGKDSFAFNGLKTRTYGNPARLLYGSSLSAKAEWSAAALKGTKTLKSNAGSLSMGAGLLSLSGSAKGSFSLMKKGKFSPSASLSAKAKAAIATAGISGTLGSGAMQASAWGSADVGAVYGKVEAVISVDEQVLEAACGAAALRGECGIAINLFGLKVEVGISGSVGSCEAGFSYRHVNSEFEVGAKAGFIAGGGVRMKVSW